MSFRAVRKKRFCQEQVTLDVASLKAKAEAAASGIWEYSRVRGAIGPELPKDIICIAAQDADAEFISAASPTVILALIEENEHLKSCLAIQSAVSDGAQMHDNLSVRLRRERFNRRATCRMLAQELGLPPSRISEIENGIGKRTYDEEEKILTWLRKA